jgi:hypothetical protein
MAPDDISRYATIRRTLKAHRIYVAMGVSETLNLSWQQKWVASSLGVRLTLRVAQIWRTSLLHTQMWGY